MLYQPAHFSLDDRATTLALLHEYPFATLLSRSPDDIAVTHLPLHAVERDGAITLLGHVARANPHWRLWDDGTAVTAIFHGPQAYISPSWYATREAVPTWNYIVVHAQGTVAVTHDSEAKELILKTLIDRHDPPYRQQWNEELSEELREKLKAAIVGFAISVERLEAKFKLGQNRSAIDKAGVLAQLNAGDAQARAAADWMQRLGIGT